MKSLGSVVKKKVEMDLSEYESFDLARAECSAALAARFGLHSAPSAFRNCVHVHKKVRALAGHLNFGGNDNEIFFGADCSFHGEIVSMGDRSRTKICGGQHTLNLQAFVYSAATLEIGIGTVAYGLRVWVSEERSLRIGERCLFSEGISIRTTDHHSIFEIETSNLLNQPADILIGDRVWVNQDVTILKGVTIGSGSIIGAKALVVRPVPSVELWSGVPARMIRQKVSWLEPNPASKDQIAARLDELGLPSA